jgi:hypothetical protein
MGGLPSSLLSIPPVSFVMPRGSLNWKILVFGTEMKPISYKTTCYLHIHGPKIILQVIVKYLTSPLEICLPITPSVASIKGLCSCCLISFQQDLISITKNNRADGQSTGKLFKEQNRADSAHAWHSY